MQEKHKLHRISLQEINPSVSEALIDFARELKVDLAGNERLLPHGTPDCDRARGIATEGFDNRVARNGLFGKGTYFAAQTCKSAQYATPDGMKSKASPQMVGTMLIARVAIGDPYYAPRGCPDLSRALPESSLFCTLIEVNRFCIDFACHFEKCKARCGLLVLVSASCSPKFFDEEQDNQGPPEKNGVRADSIIAKPGIPNGQPAGVQSHMEVVTFDPAQAYPEFIVRFTEE